MRRPGAVGGAQLGAHGGLDGGHQQRRGDPLAGHVADGEGQLRAGQRHEIVVIAGDHAGRIADALQLQRLGGWHVPREKLLLHFARDFQLGLQALFFLGDHDQLAEVLGHGVEGSAHFGKLVVALDRDAIGEIAFLDVLRALIDLMHGAGHGARETDAGPERADFHKQQQGDYGDENRLRRGPPNCNRCPGLAARR